MTRQDSIECPCGGKYFSKTKHEHALTKRHIRYLETGEKQLEKTYFSNTFTPEEQAEKRREYFREFYKKHSERWKACPSYNNGKPIKIN